MEKEADKKPEDKPEIKVDRKMEYDERRRVLKLTASWDVDGCHRDKIDTYTGDKSILKMYEDIWAEKDVHKQKLDGNLEQIKKIEVLLEALDKENESLKDNIKEINNYIEKLKARARNIKFPIGDPRPKKDKKPAEKPEENKDANKGPK